MNAEQKRAWLGVGTMGMCVVLYFILLGIIGPFAATAAFAVFGVNGLAGLIGRNDQTDERDHAIAKKATSIGFVASYEAFIVACMATWAVVYTWLGKENVSIHVLPMITMFGGIVFYFVRCLAILILYGHRMEAENG